MKVELNFALNRDGRGYEVNSEKISGEERKKGQIQGLSNNGKGTSFGRNLRPLK